MTTDFRWLPFLTINSSRMCGIRQTGYCSMMVVSTQAEGHVHHTDLFNYLHTLFDSRHDPWYPQLSYELALALARFESHLNVSARLILQ
jgi:hypothetical protein